MKLSVRSTSAPTIHVVGIVACRKEARLLCHTWIYIECKQINLPWDSWRTNSPGQARRPTNDYDGNWIEFRWNNMTARIKVQGLFPVCFDWAPAGPMNHYKPNQGGNLAHRLTRNQTMTTTSKGREVWQTDGEGCGELLNNGTIFGLEDRRRQRGHDMTNVKDSQLQETLGLLWWGPGAHKTNK